MPRYSIILLLLFTGGCAVGGARPLRPYELALLPYGEGQPESFVGSLSYEGRCLQFRRDGDGTMLIPIWPTGSSSKEQLIIFHRPAKADQRVAVGEEVRLDGQTTTWASLPGRYFEGFKVHCGGAPFLVRGLAPAN